ncbi:low temperature requirement protein A [Cellulomonas sp. URHE0023]|uniref:low temperature requirement protein A n=1 Tax=Cellulomonas sp. URHE0023 TaxID=1380354 RepID=UPI00068EE8D7|nr:low temperature requirement protein A [Cellulomonas sp. URHE0023]
MSQTAAPSGDAAAHESERHATWKELFFDLVVVAGIAQLAHLAQDDPGTHGLGLYSVLFLAFWITWAGFAVYGDIAGDDARTPVLLFAMVGLAVMAASVPQIRGPHATAFVIAYVALRWFASGIWQRGKVVLDWPLAQQGLGAVPWLVSLWVDAPGRYWLWAAGIAIDLTTLLLSSAELTLKGAQERLARGRDGRKGRDGSRGRDRDAVFVLQPARTDDAHLSERLGLFVIIVLGEGVIQIIDAVAGLETWTPSTAVTALGAFAVLALVWAVGLQYGVAGIPNLRAATVAPRIVLLLHAALTGTLAALAAALGVAVEHHDEALPLETRVLMCAAVAAYCTIGVVTAVLVGTNVRWMLGWGLPSIVVPILLAVLGTNLRVGLLVWLLAAVLFWLVLHSPGRPTPWERPPRERAAKRPAP